MYLFYFDLVFIRCILKALNTSWRSSSILSTHFVGVEFSLPSTNECCLNSVSYLTKSKVFSVLAFLIWSLSQQATIIPKPEWSGHFGGTLKLQSPPFRVTKRRSRWNLPRCRDQPDPVFFKGWALVVLSLFQLFDQLSEHAFNFFPEMFRGHSYKWTHSPCFFNPSDLFVGEQIVLNL